MTFDSQLLKLQIEVGGASVKMNFENFFSKIESWFSKI